MRLVPFRNSSTGAEAYPAINVFGDGDGTVIRAEVPGLAPETLHVQVDDRTVTISGKRELHEPAQGSFQRRERSLGEFSRCLRMATDLDLGKLQASVRLGVLTLRVPRREEARPREIKVRAGKA